MPKVAKKRWVKRPITEADVPGLVEAVKARHADTLYAAMTQDSVVRPKPAVSAKAKGHGPYDKSGSDKSNKRVRFSTTRSKDDSDDEDRLDDRMDDRLAEKLASLAQENAFESDEEEDFPDLGSAKTSAAMADEILNSEDEGDDCYDDKDAAALGMEEQQTGGFYKTFADYVFEAIEENKRQEAEKEKMALFTPLTIETYTQVKKFLAHYRSGRLPKALKLIPGLKNWMDVLWLTGPEQWTPHAVEAVTTLFVKNLKESQVQKYLQAVVLPAVQKSIDQDKRLNVHLYNALKHALYKPAPWFKGIFFPTILDDQCTYKRAVILCSVLSKFSFPASNCGAAIVILCHHKPYNNVIAFCLIKLINKKHNLPITVVSELLHFFRGFLNVDEPQSVIWHQALLTFIQRWKGSLTMEQVEVVREILKKHNHASITAEIRRELM